MKQEVVNALKFTKISKKELENLIENPKDWKRGDYALPCFSLSKRLKKSPVEIAKDIASKIKYRESFDKVEAIGPYVNFFVNSKKLAGSVVDRIGKEGEKYGSGKHSKEKVILEFSQPNTHKAFHVGHIRGTSYGESLARIMKFCGEKVVKVNYSGDTGMHIAKWIWCYSKYHSGMDLKEDEAWVASIYVDAVKRLSENPELQEEVDEINRKIDSRRDKKLNDLWEKTRKLSVDSWKVIYDELNTGFDRHYFESEVEKRGKVISQNLVKKGIAKISQEATIVDLEKEKLGIWVLLRKDGTVLYSAKDLALAERKFKDFDVTSSLIITDSSQDLHFKQLIKTLGLMKFKHTSRYKHLSFNSVRLPQGKMSSRTGDNILYSDFKKELVDYAIREVEKRYDLESTEIYDRALAIAIASMKYVMLKQEPNKVIVFDKKEAMRFDGDTGPYLLYSYARSQSILRKAKYRKSKKFNILSLKDKEKKLVSELSKFPEIVKHSYDNLAPNIIANYAYALAKTFSEFYHDCVVIGSKNEQFRLRLVDSFSQVIKNSLYLLGINVISQM